MTAEYPIPVSIDVMIESVEYLGRDEIDRLDVAISQRKQDLHSMELARWRSNVFARFRDLGPDDKVVCNMDRVWISEDTRACAGDVFHVEQIMRADQSLRVRYIGDRSGPSYTLGCEVLSYFSPVEGR